MLLIPVIAFALAKGSDMAFVSMATGLMAPAQVASSGASAQAAAGNFNAGNISIGNTSMNSASANKPTFLPPGVIHILLNLRQLMAPSPEMKPEQ